MPPVPIAPVLVALTRRGLLTARRVAPHLLPCRIHVYAPRLGEETGTDYAFYEVADHLRDLFRQHHPVITTFSAAIAIRALAPCLQDKQSEPPVIAVSEDGKHIVPLLGSHHGGLALAHTIAEATGGVVAATASGDGGAIPALDCPPPGWRVGNPGVAKSIMADMLAGHRVGVVKDVDDGGWLAPDMFHAGAKRQVVVTPYVPSETKRDLYLHPPVVAVGVGCERGIAEEELIDLITTCLKKSQVTSDAIACLCSLDIKMNEDAVHKAAAHFSCPVRFFTPARLEEETPRLATPSDLVYRETGCHGVAEGAALAAVGDGGHLVCAKTKSVRATCAVSLASSPLDVDAIGCPRGHLLIVGLGPGGRGWLTPEVRQALDRVDDIVGYRLYVDQAASLAPQACRHDFALGEEVMRVHKALDLATQGRRVALVSSGDAGVYGMAAVVFDVRHNSPKWSLPAISVLPGMTAMQAAAARAGAPLGHDFCAISLSDLLTPWKIIKNRLQAAADADFVVALYNPASQKRCTQLARARDILLTRRAAHTPVVLARNLGRDDETVHHTTLDRLTGDDVDMLTIILVGNSQTRRDDTGAVYTPRGYRVPRDRADTMTGQGS